MKLHDPSMSYGLASEGSLQDNSERKKRVMKSMQALA